MFKKIDIEAQPGPYCSIAGIGHSKFGASDKFKKVYQEDFIESLPEETRNEILSGGKTVSGVAEKWGELTSDPRMFFGGGIEELGLLAIKDCLNTARDRVVDFNPEDIGAIIGATNTGPGYPSLADFIKNELGLNSAAMCFDVTEACTAGSVALLNGYGLIKSGVCKSVLVICAEKATTLTNRENWRGSNLFGDASFAVLLEATDEPEKESFALFNYNSFPLKGNLGLIKKTETGFVQNGAKVHVFAIDTVVKMILESVERAGVNEEEIKHIVLHQPSKRTMSSMKANILNGLPGFSGIVHESEGVGNASSASFGRLLSKRFQENVIKPGELILTCTFGAGLSVAVCAMKL